MDGSLIYEWGWQGVQNDTQVQTGYQYKQVRLGDPEIWVIIWRTDWFNLGPANCELSHQVITDVVSGQMGIWISGLKPGIC